MYLIIDPSVPKEVTLHYSTARGFEYKNYPAERSKGVVYAMYQLLQELQLTPSDVQGIAVLLGTGNFTATRVATVVANSWSFACHIPVVGVSTLDVVAVERRLREQPASHYISAVYSAAPRLGGHC